MELHSPPEMIERRWIALEIGFTAGVVTYDLELGDSFTIDENGWMRVKFGEGQIVWVNLALTPWYSTRPRTQMVPVKPKERT